MKKLYQVFSERYIDGVFMRGRSESESKLVNEDKLEELVNVFVKEAKIQGHLFSIHIHPMEVHE